jgi:dTDP-4-dehydrorhamnose 3,5-epimerase
VYKCTDYYAPEHEISVLWNDPELAIKWPLVNNAQPLLSAKDANGVTFATAPAFK